MKFIGILKIKGESNASFHSGFLKLISAYLEKKKIKHKTPQTLLQRKETFCWPHTFHSLQNQNFSFQF